LRSVLQVFIFFICKEYPFSLAKAQKFFYDEHPYLIKFVIQGFPMSKNMLSNIMKQAQQMQERVKKLQEEAAGKTVEASSGGGMVTVVANGRQEVLSIKIDPSVVDPKDIDMLQDLVTAAVNEALRKSQDLMKEEMGKLTAGMGLPPGLL
jgi:DNA-binding YbaB/EbfC family protein